MSTGISTVFEQGAWLKGTEFVCLMYKMNKMIVYEFLEEKSVIENKKIAMPKSMKDYVFVTNCPKYINENSSVDKNILVTNDINDVYDVTKNKTVYIARDYSEVKEISDYWLN